MAKKATVQNTNEYEKKEVVSSRQSVYINEYKEVDLKTIFNKVEQEIKKRRNKLDQKNAKVASISVGSVSISLTLNIKRLETDAEYNRRIAAYEKQQSALRKKEEDKIKREFKKLQELQSKFANISSEEEAIMKSRMEKCSLDIIQINNE